MASVRRPLRVSQYHCFWKYFGETFRISFISLLHMYEPLLYQYKCLKWKWISKNFSGASVKWILIATEKKSRNFAVMYASPFAVCLLCVRHTSVTTSQRPSLCPEHTHRLATKTNWTSNYMNKLLNYTVLSARRVSVLTRKEQQISRSWETRLL